MRRRRPDQRAALNRAIEPSWENPLVTVSHMQDFMPTPPQKEALDSAQNPDAGNPFVTASQLQELVPTADQKDALDAADAPSAANPFVTQSKLPKLPADPPPPAWPIGLTPAQDAALDAAEAGGTGAQAGNR